MLASIKELPTGIGGFAVPIAGGMMQQISPWFQTAKLISGLRKTFSKMVAVRGDKHGQNSSVRCSDAAFPDSAHDKSEHGGS